jgi:hypothetical protein
MAAEPRLRQVALVAGDCGQVAGELRRAFGWGEPYEDPGVARFGLSNAVFGVGDTFVEVVAPQRPGTTAGRYLAEAGQRLRFVPAGPSRGEGIVAVSIDGLDGQWVIGGVTFASQNGERP